MGSTPHDVFVGFERLGRIVRNLLWTFVRRSGNPCDIVKILLLYGTHEPIEIVSAVEVDQLLE